MIFRQIVPRVRRQKVRYIAIDGYEFNSYLWGFYR